MVLLIVPRLMAQGCWAVLDESAVSRRAVCPGVDAHAGLEHPVQVTLVEESAGGRHIARSLALAEEAARGPEAPIDQGGVRRQPGFLAEGADEMAAGQARQVRQIREIGLLAQMGVQILPHPDDAARAV